MNLPGSASSQKIESKKVAELTLKCLKESVPADVPAIAFLSGGQSEQEAAQNLNEINKLNKKIPPSAILLIENEKIYIPLKGLIDVQDEKARSKNNLVKLEKTFQGLKKQLENKKFIKNAPKSLVAERKSQLKESKVKMKKLNDHLKVLELI